LEFDDYVEIDTSNMSFAPQPEITDENKPTPPAVEEVMFTLDTASDGMMIFHDNHNILFAPFYIK